MIRTKAEADALLGAADVFFVDDPEDDEEDRMGPYVLNMNDTWAWACGDAERVPEEQVIPLANLFWRYGYAGILYWVSQQRGGARSEFFDYNRMIEFVTHEERLREQEPRDAQRAYLEISYTVTGSRNADPR